MFKFCQDIEKIYGLKEFGPGRFQSTFQIRKTWKIHLLYVLCSDENLILN